jgi:hypothetical protein
MKNNLIGKKVKVISDNEYYDSFRKKTLVITHVAYSTEDHPGYDDSIPGEALCDFKDLKGNTIPCSLYEYEFELI